MLDQLLPTWQKFSYAGTRVVSTVVERHSHVDDTFSGNLREKVEARLVCSKRREPTDALCQLRYSVSRLQRGVSRWLVVNLHSKQPIL